MIYVNSIILLLFAFLFILTRKDSLDWLKDLDRKEHKLYVLYPAAWRLVTMTHAEKYLLRKTQVSKALRALKVTDKPEALLRLYWCQKTSVILFTIILFNGLSLLGQLPRADDQGVLKNQYLIRPEIGEGERKVDLNVTVESPDQEKDEMIEDITVIITEREYTEKELEKAFQEGISYLDEKVLGNNEDKFKITEALNFLTELPGTSIQVEWKPENTKIITKDGMVYNEDVAPEGVVTNVIAILSYREKKTEHTMEFRVLPKPISVKERLLKEIKEALQQASESARVKGKWKLPGQVKEYSLTWEEAKQNSGITIFILGLAAAVLIWLYGDKELEHRMEKRNRQLLMDYPELINKFTLLVNAGMTIKQAWFKIAEDYEKKPTKGPANHRYAYEEMLLTVHELKLGVPEGEAYEQFGRRTGILPYLRFSSLIAQNLKKGSRGLSELLHKEAMDAFAERKELAKRLGEEAGTKLLGPMLVMLIIVLIIIIVPAFLSFGI